MDPARGVRKYQPGSAYPHPFKCFTSPPAKCLWPNGQARLSSGSISLERTKAWLSSAVQGFLSGNAEEGGTADEDERSRRAKGLRDGREVSMSIHTRDTLRFVFELFSPFSLLLYMFMTSRGHFSRRIYDGQGFPRFLDRLGIPLFVSFFFR